jgi:hypothetical protein
MADRDSNQQWSGLMCNRCGYEASKKLARQGKGYCLDCGHRLANMNPGQKNPYPFKNAKKQQGGA